jgi:type II secretion system protein G
MLRNNAQKGFTLIELLVVVAIIGLISSVVLSNLNGARVKARGAVRISDLRSVRTALSMYYADNGSYPVSSGWDGIYSCWGYQSTASNPNGWIAGLTTQYIPSLPRDPRNHTECNAQYIYSSNGTNYKLIVHDPESCMTETSNARALRDPGRGGDSGCWAYGYWTDGAVGW